ncbi:hypothetical protein QBC47DRAFT_387355 [Echria macrotheca]|uniref:Uncharacterized protein n=1 Tax=Echria macrotheca TaxID=438768 RepID=A0AAJ0B9G7_9PEZI|nr:hypothetical protein QBC47DRAFT_387355 [Echria macrotheca]
MPIIRATDIVNLMAAGTQQDEQTMTTLRNMASRVTSHLRELAEMVVCYAEDMEYAEGRTNLLRLPDLTLAHSVQRLNTEFHMNMAKPLYKWVSGKGFSIDRKILDCNILWLQGGGIECDPGRVVVLIFVRRPRRRDDGGVIEDAQGTATGIAVLEEPLSKGSIKSPIAHPITAASLFECQVGDMIFLAEGEQVFVREQTSVKEGTGPRDVCMFYIMHRTTPTGGAGEGDTA